MNDSTSDPTAFAHPVVPGQPTTLVPTVAPGPGTPDQATPGIDALLRGLSEAATGDTSANKQEAQGTTDNGAQAPHATDESRVFENQLAMVRLGMATSLFYALRTKHAPTAAHSLRVAISCSAWSERLGLNEQTRDRIEVAALLHDIGKIGIPDRILRKPAKLSAEEQLTMGCCAELGCEILRGCTDDQSLLDMIRHAGDWFDSRRHDETIRGDALPLGSRMLAIAGAFDAMTTDQVYRSAFSRERAIQELFRSAGTQFDPELSRDFAAMLEQRPEMLHGCVVNRWLQQLDVSQASLWGKENRTAHVATNQPSPLALGSMVEHVTTGAPIGTLASATESRLQHYQTLADHLRDGVAFTDREGQILYWNDSLAQMTRVTADACVGQFWDSASLNLVGNHLAGEAHECPVTQCNESQVTVTLSMTLATSSLTKDDSAGQSKPTTTQRDVLVQAVPIADSLGGGAVVIVRDTSDRAEMQSQIQSLHKRATSDPLTGVANRAEFDKRLLHCTTKAMQKGETFSLIMCDIDHFKQVNDVHGHQAGDEALIEFSKILEQHSRGSDLVARYGGEEFVFLAINSDNATATRRAEEIRKAVSVSPLKGLGGESVTVSIGVTQYQTGDAPDTVVARADRALLQAKENGRNRVVQLGSGRIDEESTEQSSGWFSWLQTKTNDRDHHCELVTPVPTDLAVEKLRGFIADHRAEIINVTGSELSLRLMAQGGTGRRAADHQMALHVHVQLSEVKGKRGGRGNSITQTMLSLTIKPVRGRDRRSANLKGCISQVVNSLRSYLMAELVANEDQAS